VIITSSSPLRISLVGGSTDHPHFLKKYKTGSVISFPSNLKVYVTVHKDVFGANSLNKKYVLNYSNREEVDNICDIKNEMIRYSFDELDVSQINLFLTSDVFSNGSGLASSSAYIMALIKSIYQMRDRSITESEICKLSMKIERKFNPLVGQQDFWGSMGGLKRINFHDGSDPEIKYLDTTIFNDMDMYLIFTGLYRSSTKILETIDIDKSLLLLDDVKKLEKSILENDQNLFHQAIKSTWINKKNTSKNIYENPIIQELDNKIENDKSILSHKLLGAGNGGYFLVFMKKGTKLEGYKNFFRVFISDSGIKSQKL
jgi:D-glycero-alpha-D-manno-heptose-7-phosphate kinase